MKEIWFGIAYGQISSMFDTVICPQHNNGGVLKFNIFICENKKNINSLVEKVSYLELLKCQNIFRSKILDL